MDIRLLTFCYFGIRPDRPDEYYLTPLMDYLRHLAPFAESLPLEVYTRHAHVDRLAQLPFGTIIGSEPEELMAEVWDDPKALDIYHDLIKHNPTHHSSYQARFRRLIAVYLAKAAAIRRAFRSGCDACFWFDSGHWVSYQAGHDFSRYSPGLQERVAGLRLAERLVDAATRHGVIGCLALPGKTRFHMPLEWMHAYAPAMGYSDPRRLPLCSAVFWLVHRTRVDLFFECFRRWWLRLVADGRAGIEENALTLATWEQKFPLATYDAWVSVLCGEELSARPS